jgi:transposase
VRRHDRIYRGRRAWTPAYRRWLTKVRFDHPARQIVLQDKMYAVEDAEARGDRLRRQIEELLPSWSMAPVVKALQRCAGSHWWLRSALWRKRASSAASPTSGS